jgi:hypothetical protein
MKTLMWFEPERITDPESLVKNYGYQLEWAIRREGNTAISNNIGDPACFRWTVDRIKKTHRTYSSDARKTAAISWILW